ncbi:MAG: ATP synthase F1 subunit gamma [Parcubacteria group bacterium]|nr:ATP synthase F1 subunit gamma [Parcubacteria group bacterium]
MAVTRQVKDKIRATSNIKQITKAMEMVAATKMRKAEETALRARPYAKEAVTLLRNLLFIAQKEELTHHSHYFKKAEGGPMCLVVVTSDRGLAGAFNANVLRRAMRFHEEHANVDIVAVGKKAEEFFARRGVKAVASFAGFSSVATLSEISPLAEWLITRYQNHTYDKVTFCSTMFVSALVQRTELTDLLPLTMEGLQNIIEGIVPSRGKYSEMQTKREEVGGSHLFEPSAQEIFESILPELVRAVILHIIFESNASEHSSRMVAMKNATENAEDLIESLTLQLNKARQAAITQELAEVTTAKEALTAD